MTEHSPDPGKNGRVGIFLFAYPLFNNPSVINFARGLAEQGCQVDIFTDYQQPDEFVFADAGSLSISIHQVGRDGVSGDTTPHWERSLQNTEAPPPARGLLHRMRRRLRLLLPARVQARIMPVWGELQWLSRLVRYMFICRKHVKAHQYTCFVGAEVYGLAVATALGRWGKVPIVYDDLIRFLRKILVLQTGQAIFQIAAPVVRDHDCRNQQSSIHGIGYVWEGG